ncbi:hypothetical protein AN664_0229600 [Serratia marcescens]|nr:hypothetical protein AN699_0229870 [Serratia marcescens]OCN24766.1 hypothetical protein AN701_0229840 [Serratia marcescens]OCN45352.1 hypothetical protein AN658_0230010 [Serratia marcescens]OCN46314.1 hypothetical protein AN660_0229795 [Serratia marcescens]OCN66189.1 hypothetical protein AN664_0229600 [Serratia marcescens]
MVILVGLAIDQIAQSGLSSLSVIYYSAQLFSVTLADAPHEKKTIASKEYLLSFIIMASLMFFAVRPAIFADLTGCFYQLYEMLNCVVALAGPTVTLSDVAIYLAT